jgi:hypothetical protein
MPRTEVTVQAIISSSIVEPAQTASDQANGMQFQNDGKTYLKCVNGDASSRTLTFQTAKEVAGYAVADLAVVVANGVTRLMGPFPPEIFNQVDGKVYLDFSAGTPATLTVGVNRLGVN